MSVFSGLESGFVTLPRLSRAERQQPSISFPNSCAPNIHRGSLTDPSDTILSTCKSSDLKPTTATAYSDSLPSLTSLDTFTFDLGPSLMSEVFSLIDSPPEEQGRMALEGEEVGSACGLTSEGSEMDSATISYVDSLLREDFGGRKSPPEAEWQEEERIRLSVKAPDAAVVGSSERVRLGMGMESERFQSATDVLARHYGGSLLKGQSRRETADSERRMIGQPKKNMSYSYMDDEDEIKVWGKKIRDLLTLKQWLRESGVHEYLLLLYSHASRMYSFKVLLSVCESKWKMKSCRLPSSARSGKCFFFFFFF